ncbi:C45 family autoproteolytic acyltransferase/hydolase [Falsiroseomonas oryziterrae]|uniref:C45 family autoproteolytic acyltransferase/hydolase n=1 Tax=Falsiroseomonas oryziterrae TaxID=2911368 RepID=UPI001F399B90|nr:C45 family peptidase [Roseomonas sp. NPKOSM-4]
MNEAPVLRGDPRSRGLAFAALGKPQETAVRARAEEAREFARSRDAEGWLTTQWQAQRALLPEMATFIEATAEGHGMPAETLFAAHLRYAIEDRAAIVGEHDGCSAFAMARPDGGVLLAKNRDNPPPLRQVASLVRQADPAWGGRQILSVGSFGHSPTCSSGINTDGLCLADTAVRTADLGIGALRYYLMEALLIRCADVAQAVALIRALPHLGGGTLVLADASGALAAVELGHRVTHIERGARPGWVARTNHFLHPDTAAPLRERPGSVPRTNSEGRLDVLRSALRADFSAEDCAALLSRHADGDRPALCRHDPATWTNSCAVFDVAARRLRLSHGQPCEGAWRQAHLDSPPPKGP